MAWKNVFIRYYFDFYVHKKQMPIALPAQSGLLEPLAQQKKNGSRSWVLFENRPALYFFLIIHLFLPIKYIFLFRIKDTVSDILSVLLNNFIANYDSKNETIPPYCL